MKASIARHHDEWLSLIEVSGPFLTLPVLERAFPQGIEPVDRSVIEELRLALQAWHEDQTHTPQWVRWVLTRLLEFDDQTLLEGPAVPQILSCSAPEHAEILRPDMAIAEPQAGGEPAVRMLINTWKPTQKLDGKTSDQKWAATPLDRMTDLLRATGVRLGLVTNGELWTLVHAPAGGPTTFATWDAGLWLEERQTMAAFATLLGARRFFGVADSDTLESLFNESADAEQEVTGQLGLQVRQSVELLVDAFSRADRERKGALLADLEPREIYQAAVTFMMRLVFLLSAEERGLFLLGDPLYDEAYAVSTLRGQLREEADRFGEEPLERRSTAWHRLLATFRMVHAGVEHENLRLPAYGGSLFDPDRFPFLEGRASEGSNDRGKHGTPLPVDDRTVLHILDALQVLRFKGRGGFVEARRLSFRALDVEQIGHVYEGLLDHTAVHVDASAVGLAGKLEPEMALSLIEEQAQKGQPVLVEWLAEQTGRSVTAVTKDLDGEIDLNAWPRLLAACDNDDDLAARIRPYHALLRDDLRGMPQVYLADSVYVTKVGERRSSGTYYTTRALAEEMVEHALAPLVYSPGPADTADASAWKLKRPEETLGLRVCDMAMGSGAFLVAACRYLADRLVEAWSAESELRTIEPSGSGPLTVEGIPIPDDADDRLIFARRLVADRCLYGVDLNPMAVEMAKLSLWLITLGKDRPFSFVDHALRCGDSLLGIVDLEQITALHPDPARGRALHQHLLDPTVAIKPAVERAIDLRRTLEAFPVIELRDAQDKEKLFVDSAEALNDLRVVADVVIGAALSTSQQGGDALETRLVAVANSVAAVFDPQRSDSDRAARVQSLRWDAAYWLNEGKPLMAPDRRPFHWPLEFPEVFAEGGFDAVAGNPPFQGGQRISGALGADFREYLIREVAGGTRGSADLVAYFFLRAVSVTRAGGSIGLLATNTISQGDTREVALDQLTASGCTIYRAWKSRPWPGDASLEVAQVWLHQGPWLGQRVLNGSVVAGITTSMDPASRSAGQAKRLAANHDLSFQGSIVLGMGFVLAPADVQALIESNSRNAEVLFPYLNGEDLNSSPTQSPTRWVIAFTGLEEAQAETYVEPFEIVRKLVKPGRDKVKRQVRRERWWRFAEEATGLYTAIEGLSRVIVITRISKTVMPVFVPTTVVFSDATVVFVYDDDAHFGLLSSCFHWWWALTRSSTLETRIRYTPTDCFETFPQPALTLRVAASGAALDTHRRPMMIGRNEGLTKTYNRVHDEQEHAADVLELRRLHVELDYAVAEAYGWSDLALGHGFYETPQGVRFTVAPPARVELLDRLLELNHERHKAEVAAGLHDKRKPKAKRGSRANEDQISLGDGL